MTSRPTNPLRARLRAVHTRVRRAIVWRHALRASAVAVVLLAAAVTAGLALPRTPGTAWARAVLLAAGSLAALAVAVRGALRDSPRWDPWLEALEARFAPLRSWLRNALEMESRPGAHTSDELAGAVREQAARRLDDVPVGDSVPRLEARVPLVAAAAAVLAIASSVVLAPEPTLAAWRTLWSPASAAPPVELAVEPGDVTLVPGASLAVRARIAGSDAPPRLLGGEAAPAAVLEARADGGRRWRFDLPPVTSPREYSVAVAGVRSPTYRITLAGEPRAVSFSVTLTAPAYARLPQQALSGTRGDLSALAGSSAAIEVTFDRDLEAVSAALGSPADGGSAGAWSAVTPRRWRGTVPVDGDGHWDLIARGSTGEGRFRYRIEAIPDAPPVLTVTLPAGDVDLPAGSQIPYDVLVQDDLGVSELRLEWRKDAAAPWGEGRLAAFGEEPREARAAARWDASPLALLPGESGVFRFVAYDNARPGARGRAVSREIRVRFPTLSELYAKLEQRQDHVSRSLEQAAEQAKELQKSLDKLQRQPQGPNRQDPSFERAEEMKRAADRQQSVTQKLDEAAREMRQSVDEAAERQAHDEQLMRKLKEMSELLKEIQSSEFKEALKRMQEALQRMDRRAMEESLPQLRRENRDLMQQLERSLELLKQLRDEERMDALARRADELKARQDALNEEHARAPEERPGAREPEGRDAKEGSREADRKDPRGESREQARGDLSERQSKAAEESRELSKDAKETARQSEGAQAKERLEQSAEELEQNAAGEQDRASRQSEQGDSQGAQSSGQKASESLSRAAQSLRASAQREQQERDQRNLAAVRRASQDLVSLARASQENLDSRRGAPQASETQTDLSEGVARVADSLAALSQETPFLSNRISTSLGRAIQGLSQSGREMTQGGRERGERSGRGAISSLNDAVKALRETEDAMCQNPGAGSGGRTSSQRMGEVGERQSQVNQRSREMARKLSRQMSMAQGDEAEMRRLAEEQRRVREMLSEVRREEEAKKSLLGRLDQAERDMQEAEEAIRRGEVGEDLEQKQIRILSRLLDASRSLHRRDFDPEREARRGEDVAAPSPGALPPELFRENDRLRQDLLKAEADRVPSRYRPLIEAYLRSLGGTQR
jgi:hypothetical protein